MKKLLSLVLLGLICFAGFTRWQNVSEEPLIMTDGQGYYAYLPAVFIYHDLQFLFVDSVNQTYYPEGKRAKFIVPSSSGNVNKYFAGTAVLQTPFFLAGCALSWVVGAPVDGYSWPFQLMVGMAALTYLILGLYLLGNLLLGLGFEEKSVLLTLTLILFATNLLHYSVYEPSMSHVYSFFTISAFLFFVWKSVNTMTTNSFVMAAAALGLTVLIRPTNAIVVLGIPVITSGIFGTITLIEQFFANKKALVSTVVVFALIVGIQPLIYFLQTGSAIVWSYEGEGFDFLSPEVYNVLFSYRKGLFVYCPVLVLALFGLAAGSKRNKGRYSWLFVFLLASTWVISSWWMWYYGGSYGHRAFIDYYPFMAIGLATALSYGWGMLKPWVFVLVGIALIPVQLIQTYQYNKHIITFDNMSKAKYWNLFLRTGNDLAWYYSGYEGQDSYNGSDSLLVTHTMEEELGWGNEKFTGEEKHNGNRSVSMLPEDQYGITLRKPGSDISPSSNLVRISAWVKSDSRTTDLSFVCTIEDSTGTAYYWGKYPLRPQFNGTDKWSWATALFRCGALRNPTDKFVIYPMKSDKATVFIDDLEVSFIQSY